MGRGGEKNHPWGTLVVLLRRCDLILSKGYKKIRMKGGDS